MNFTHTASDYVFELHRGLPAGGPDREPEQKKPFPLQTILFYKFASLCISNRHIYHGIFTIFEK